MPTPQHHLQNALEAIASPAAEKIGYVVAGGMISTPLWRDRLHEWAGIATDLAPLLGCAWLVVQMVVKVIEARRRAREVDESEA
ncbi:MAG: hypothetical protein ACR652_00360 [Methylocystis sp.]|uniref:hypothetical protein n=1 Tax=Methylocystis sp. TaxID=1911079 RepID=UPI003DA3B183